MKAAYHPTLSGQLHGWNTRGLVLHKPFEKILQGVVARRRRDQNMQYSVVWALKDALRQQVA